MNKQFRLRIPVEVHSILKRMACDEGTTMTELFLRMFTMWLAENHFDKTDDPAFDRMKEHYLKKLEKRNCKFS